MSCMIVRSKRGSREAQQRELQCERHGGGISAYDYLLYSKRSVGLSISIVFQHDDILRKVEHNDSFTFEPSLSARRTRGR